MKVYKDKQYLIFDFEDGRTVKYDFATKTSIGIKGNPVKNLCNQLSGMSMNQIIDCCIDKNYGKFLKFVQNQYPYNISNIGTILSHVPEFSRFEQIFSAGIEYLINHRLFTRTINDIPKSMLKIARDRHITISDLACDFWYQNPDAHCIGYSLDYTSLCDNDLMMIWSAYYSNYDQYKRERIYVSYFNDLIERYGYNAKSLFLYIDTLKTYEAIEDMRYLMKELYDYARMMSEISPKFDKYPRNFLTTHKIAIRNYNRLKHEFDEELFRKQVHKGYEYKFKDYCFIYPNSTQEIKDEAVQQNNCVASYINNVINGDCHIMFLRKLNALNHSLVTIEIRNNQIVQAKRRFNDPVTSEDQEAIDAWNKKYSNKEEAA